MVETKTKTDSWLGIFSSLEHHSQPLATRGGSRAVSLRMWVSRLG